jgi:hypothetical protein
VSTPAENDLPSKRAAPRKFNPEFCGIHYCPKSLAICSTFGQCAARRKNTRKYFLVAVWHCRLFREGRPDARRSDLTRGEKAKAAERCDWICL